MAKQLRMKQIVIAPWQGSDGGMTYSTLGLGEDGKVYRYDAACEGWIQYHMKDAECGIHGHRR